MALAAASETGARPRLVVNDDAGGIDHSAQGRLQLPVQGVTGRLGDVGGSERRMAAPLPSKARALSSSARTASTTCGSGPLLQRGAERGLGEHAVDAGQRAQFVRQI